MAGSMSSRERHSYFRVPTPLSRAPFWPGGRTRVRTWCSSGREAMNASNRKDRKGPPLSVTTTTGRSSPVVASVSASASGALARRDRKSTRLNSSHANISYAVFCLKKKHTTLRRAHSSTSPPESPPPPLFLSSRGTAPAPHHSPPLRIRPCTLSSFCPPCLCPPYYP